MPCRLKVLVVVIFSCLFAGAFRAPAQGVYHNQRIFIVPTPGKVTIDGDLSDWDLSDEILTYVVESSMAYQSARTAMMYDQDALYISSRVSDPSPMLNRADPAVNPDFVWAGRQARGSGLSPEGGRVHRRADRVHLTDRQGIV